MTLGNLTTLPGGEAFKPDNAFYVLYAEAFQLDDTATQGVAGITYMWYVIGRYAVPQVSDYPAWTWVTKRLEKV